MYVHISLSHKEYGSPMYFSWMSQIQINLIVIENLDLKKTSTIIFCKICNAYRILWKLWEISCSVNHPACLTSPVLGLDSTKMWWVLETLVNHGETVICSSCQSDEAGHWLEAKWPMEHKVWLFINFNLKYHLMNIQNLKLELLVHVGLPHIHNRQLVEQFSRVRQDSQL